MYWENLGFCYIKSNKDMITYSGSIVNVSLKPSGFTEGLWFYKCHGKYYFVYAANGILGSIAYSTLTGPTGYGWARAA